MPPWYDSDTAAGVGHNVAAGFLLGPYGKAARGEPRAAVGPVVREPS
jgi:hypothetical protein